MGLFFYTKIGSIIFIGDLPTTNIIEPFFVYRGQKRGQNLNELVPEQIFQILANSNCVAEIIQMKLIIVK